MSNYGYTYNPVPALHASLRVNIDKQAPSEIRLRCHCEYCEPCESYELLSLPSHGGTFFSQRLAEQPYPYDSSD